MQEYMLAHNCTTIGPSNLWKHFRENDFPGLNAARAKKVRALETGVLNQTQI